MCVTKDSFLLKRPQQYIVSRTPSGPRAIVSAEGWIHSCGGTYVLSSSWLGILGLRGLMLVSLVKNDGATTTSNGASTTVVHKPLWRHPRGNLQS